MPYAGTHVLRLWIWQAWSWSCVTAVNHRVCSQWDFNDTLHVLTFLLLKSKMDSVELSHFFQAGEEMVPFRVTYLWRAIITSMHKCRDLLTMSKETLSPCIKDHTLIPVIYIVILCVLITTRLLMDMLCGLIEKEEMWARILIFNYELIIYVAFICVSQRVGFIKMEFLYLRIGWR